MCNNCRCKQGDQGPEGPAGPSYTISSSKIAPKAFDQNTSIGVIASTTAGTLTFWGNVSIELTAPALITVTPYVDAAAQTDLNSVVSVPLNSTGCLAISGQIAVTAGQVFTLRVDIGVVNGAEVLSGNINYSMQ